MSPKLRRIVFGTVIAVLVAAGPVAFLDYFLPHHEILRIVGTEVRRPPTYNKSASEQAGTARDIFYIFAEEIDTKKPHVFRNEDTGWGFPWYFKFNSADLQATGLSIAAERGTALFTYYGWRVQIFSVLPNVINIKRVAPDAKAPLPWFNLAFAGGIIGGAAWLALWIRGVRNRRRVVRRTDSGAK